MGLEQWEYTDKGCELFPACLKCPLERCRYDSHIAKAKTEKIIRNAEIISCYHQGYDLSKLASDFNLDKRTVQRIITGASNSAQVQTLSAS